MTTPAPPPTSPPTPTPTYLLQFGVPYQGIKTTTPPKENDFYEESDEDVC